MRRVNLLKWSVFTLCIVLLAVFQMQAAIFPKIMGTTPVFTIPAVIAVAMLEGENAGGVYGIIAGLIWDCGTGRVFGFNALFLMIIGITAGMLVKFLFKNSGLSAFILTAIFTITHELITWFFFYYMTDQRDLTYAFMHIILPTTVLTLVFSVPLFIGARALSLRLTVADNSNKSL